VDHFQESDFVALDGSPIKVAKVSGAHLWGRARLARWLRTAIDEATQSLSPQKLQGLTLVLMASDPSRPLNDEHEQFESIKSAQSALQIRLGPYSKVFPGGRGSLGYGLSYARELLQKGKADQIVIAGVDSFLNAADIGHYLNQKRLLVSGNSDGFIPGEGAAAILLKGVQAKDRPAQHLNGSCIVGIGLDTEAARPDGDIPNRAQGLSRAIRQALRETGCTMSDITVRLSDQNGEVFFAKEAANAITRCAEDGGTVPAVLTTSDCTGEIGAATGLLMLAWLYQYLGHADAPGPIGLIHLASDGGDRSALVVRHYSRKG
jgi:3-oxoacyl-[acyl-carrier-protein] synthase-1